VFIGVGPAIEVATRANVGKDVDNMVRTAVGATIRPVGLAGCP